MYLICSCFAYFTCIQIENETLQSNEQLAYTLKGL